MKISQEELIKNFIQKLANTFPHLEITRWPDKEIRRTREIDALAEGRSARIAIEHTSIDSYPCQREYAVPFMNAIGELGAEIGKQMVARISLITDVGAVPKRISWPDIRKNLKKWLLDNHRKWPLGRSDHSIPGVPFLVTIFKEKDGSPGLFPSRWMPNDPDFPGRIKTQMNDKADKVQKYQSAGWKTVLLIESPDDVLMTSRHFKEAIEKAYPSGPPPGTDTIIFADTSVPNDVWYSHVIGCPILTPQDT